MNKKLSNFYMTLAILAALISCWLMNSAPIALPGTIMLAVMLALLASYHNDKPDHTNKPIPFGFKRISPCGKLNQWWDGKHWISHSQMMNLITKKALMLDEIPYKAINRMIEQYELWDDPPITAYGEYLEEYSQP